MSVKYILFCVGLSLHYQLIYTLDTCQTRTTCGECIRDPSVCVWCGMNNFNETQLRCRLLSSYDKAWCPESEQIPENLVHASVAKAFSSNSSQVIQIKPQQYKLKLRPGMPAKFNFSFQGAKDFPVDLYFLLDASKTMEPIKNVTARESENIYFAIKKMTDNVHLGLGTFIDKRVLPFTKNTMDTELTYSFRHRLKLVDDFMRFRDVVAQTPTGENRDVQEGGLDALAQVMTCKNIIGWRNESRKIVVFLTDGPYHAAGDGRAAGLVKPFDGKCYTENGTYTKEREMDYPSVGIINKLAVENDIIIIFLVDNRRQVVYDELRKVISGSRLAGYTRNKQNSVAIVKILEDIYEKISKKIKLKVNVKSGGKKNFEFTFNPDCTTDKSGNECNVEIGKEQHLFGSVKLLQYYGADKAEIDIVVEGIGEKLKLDIDIIKSCECEKDVEIHSAFCHGEKRVCGRCSCGDDRYGERCACVKSKSNSFSDNSTCISEGGKDICNGHGSCICGTCQCRERYEGKFCECNVDSCPRGAGGEVCNRHGACYCGTCNCDPGWSGDACQCSNTDTSCRGSDGRVCNNRGQCECGGCQCDAIAEWDARNDQDLNCKMTPCTDCQTLQCRKLEECAKCRRNGEDNCFSCDDRIKTIVVEKLTDEYLNSSLWQVCRNVKVEVGCYTNFVYLYNDTDYTLEMLVTPEKDCAKTFYMFGGLFLLTLLLVGIGTLIGWKLLTEARDRHEYLRFLKQNEADNSGPSCNPLYEEPSTTVINPAFRKRSVECR